MSWKRWQRGLLIAALTGLCAGTVDMIAGGTLKTILAVVAFSIAKDVMLYLKQHPIESVADTEIIRKVPMLFAAVALLCSVGCARLVSHQVRIESDGARVESWQKVTTFWDSKASVAKLRASSTDKTQGLTLAGVEQETAASNATSFASEIVGAAVRAAIHQ